MSKQQVDSLTARIADLEQQLSAVHQQLGAVRGLLLCSKRNPEFPLQPHGPTKVCQSCYDALRIEHAKLAVVVGSINTLVKEWMASAKPCPFCHQTKRHSQSCYLDSMAGVQILDEYRAIEQHRDMLLVERSRSDALKGPAPVIPRVRLKGLLHRNGSGG